MPSSVVTQFAEDKLTQFFVQNGKRIDVPAPTDSSISDSSDITPELCTNAFTVFDDFNRFDEVGGFTALNQALNVPMVLVMSIWDDVSSLRSLFRLGCEKCWHKTWNVADSLSMIALLQHALARLVLPPGEGRSARWRPWTLRPGFWCAVRRRGQPP